MWREKAAALDPTREDGALADLKALESLAAEASRIHVALPEAKARARAPGAGPCGLACRKPCSHDVVTLAPRFRYYVWEGVHVQ